MLLREMGVLPVGQLLSLGYLTTETDRVDLLQPKFHDAVLHHHLLQIDAVGRYKITPAPQTVDIVPERQTYFAYIRVGKEIR